jgi:DNA-directed RNA polymerase specialized sigma24 family protein
LILNTLASALNGTEETTKMKETDFSRSVTYSLHAILKAYNPAWNAMIRDRYKYCCYLALIYLHDPADVPDAVQDSFVQALASIRGFNAGKIGPNGQRIKGCQANSINEFFAWHRTILIRICYKYNKAKLAPVVPLDGLDIDPQGSAGPEQSVVIKAFIESAISSDEPYTMEEWEMVFDGYSIREIAERFGREQDAVETRMRRLRKKLRALYLKNKEN